MVSKRDRIVSLTNYIKSLGIDVRIGETKARGNKGIFLRSKSRYRIDVSKNLNDDETLSVLLHEFAHYIHWQYDSTLESLNFIFPNFGNDILEELLKITVDDVPVDVAKQLCEQKKHLTSEIKDIVSNIKNEYSHFKASENARYIEKNIPIPFKYLLKYDRVKFIDKYYSVENLGCYYNLSTIEKNYILLKSKKRQLSRINSRISRLNNYYNNMTELFARFAEKFFQLPNYTQKIAPKAYKQMEKAIKLNKIHDLNVIYKIINL